MRRRGAQSRYGAGTRGLSLLLSALLVVSPALAAARSAAPASDGKAPTLGVVVLPLDEVEGTAEAAMLLQYLAEQTARSVGRHKVLGLASLLDRDGATERAEHAEEGQAQLEAARRLYDDLDMKKADELAVKAMVEFEKSDLVASFPSLVRAWVLRIASLIAGAEQRLASVELNLLLHHDPKATFDPSLFTPDFIAQAKQRREEIRARSNLTLSLGSKPAPAVVYVNGVYRGVTPLEVKGLPAADHYVTLVSPGYRYVQKRLRPGGPRAVETLEPLSALDGHQSRLANLRHAFRGERRSELARELAKELNVDEILAVGVGNSGAQYQVLATRVEADARRTLGTREEVLRIDEGRSAVAACEDFLHKLLSADVPVEEQGGAGAWTSRHTGYLLLGLAVAGVVTGAIFGNEALQAQKRYDENTSLPQTNPVFAQYERNGKQYALIADLSFVGALLAGGAGGYLVLKKPSRPSEERVLAADEARATPGPGTQDPELAAPPKPARESESERGRKKSRSAAKDDIDEWHAE